MATVVRGFAATSNRCRGWLRYLYPKATTPDERDKNGKPHSHLDSFENVIKMLLAGVLGGAIGGFIVGGGGSRIVMRVLAIANEHTTGVVTEGGNIAGEVTAGGTISLLIIGTIIGGLGGLFYVLARRWLPAHFMARAVAFSILAFLVSGGVLLDENNTDFLLFGPASLAVGLFSLLYLPYGLATSSLVDRFDRYVPPPFSSGVGTVIGGLLLIGLTVFGAFYTVASIKTIA